MVSSPRGKCSAEGRGPARHCRIQAFIPNVPRHRSLPSRRRQRELVRGHHRREEAVRQKQPPHILPSLEKRGSVDAREWVAEARRRVCDAELREADGEEGVGGLIKRSKPQATSN